MITLHHRHTSSSIILFRMLTIGTFTVGAATVAMTYRRSNYRPCLDQDVEFVQGVIHFHVGSSICVDVVCCCYVGSFGD